MGVLNIGSIKKINGVTQSIEKKLNKLGLNDIFSLLWHLPYRFEDWSTLAQIKDLKDNEQNTIKGKLQMISTRRSWGKRRMYITEAIMADESGTIKIVWFNQPYLSKMLHVGDEIYIAGKISGTPIAKQILAPQWEKVNKTGAIHTGRIVPIYHTTEGLTQKQLRFFIKQACVHLPQLQDWIPKEKLDEWKILPLAESIYKIHFPNNVNEIKTAFDRIKFDELIRIQLISGSNRAAIAKENAPSININVSKIKEFVNSLKFELTVDQKKAAWEIVKDISLGVPMNRLLEGDVGCGKTIVVALLAYLVKLAGYQTAIMAPTEILALQHYETLQNIFKNLGVSIFLKTARTRKLTPSKITDDIIIGTHALISEDVSFKNLALVVVDEQHRFGVDQRKLLKEKSGLNVNIGNNKMAPHFLSVSATPIPRTLALTLWGDLKLSIIKTMPAGRMPVITKVVRSENRVKAYEFIKNKIKEGRQAFVVCPLVEANEKLEAKSVKEEYERLKKDIFGEIEIGMIYGKMKSVDKEKVMKDFSDGTIKILIATSVIEVGVNVPNATIIMIEGAERFGLAQLHQFRGRVGRGLHQAYCLIFMSDSEKGFLPDVNVLERLSFFAANKDGFKIAEYDLENRGFGDMYGRQQSGTPGLKYATLKDVKLIKKTHVCAEEILQNGIEKYKTIFEKFNEWQKKVHFE